jgi:hypothetical protein
MTTTEYGTALAKMDDASFAKYRAEFGGDGTRDQYVSDFVSNPAHERRICQILNLPTQEEKVTEATLISARAAADSAASSRWAMICALVSVMIALAALVLQLRAVGR